VRVLAVALVVGLRVAGFGALCAAAWTVAPALGLVAVAGSCWVLEHTLERHGRGT